LAVHHRAPGFVLSQAAALFVKASSGDAGNDSPRRDRNRAQHPTPSDSPQGGAGCSLGAVETNALYKDGVGAMSFIRAVQVSARRAPTVRLHPLWGGKGTVRFDWITVDHHVSDTTRR
jgi:hypothetical protein